MPELWRDITIDTIEQRRALLRELHLPELQARMGARASLAATGDRRGGVGCCSRWIYHTSVGTM